MTGIHDDSNPASGTAASPPAGHSYRNEILRSLAPDDLAYIEAELEPVSLTMREPIARPDELVEHVYFPESGIVSLVARTPDVQIEVGLAGREGAAGLAAVLGVGSAPVESFVQMDGRAHRITGTAMRAAMREREGIDRAMLAHVHVTYIQVANTALANGRNTIEERLARWLLMVQDRQDGVDIRITHEFLALMLGVHRPGVTLAMHTLEGAQLIRSTRGLVTIRDRTALLEVAGQAYGGAEAEHARLFPAG